MPEDLESTAHFQLGAQTSNMVHNCHVAVHGGILADEHGPTGMSESA